MKGSAPDWNAARYLRFEDERTLPARDLLARVPRSDAARVVDLGCGPGNSTALLCARYTEAAVVGVDSSADMIERARQTLTSCRFEQADVVSWLAAADLASVDVLYSNALLQWIPRHLQVIAAAFARTRLGAVLALQVPDNHDEPSHRAMRSVAEAMGLGERTRAAEVERDPIPSAEQYYDALVVHGSVQVWRTEYMHALPNAEAIVAWFETSGLRPYLALLQEPERAEYLRQFLAAMRDAYPVRADGTVLLRFPRRFVVAQRS